MKSTAVCRVNSCACKQIMSTNVLELVNRQVCRFTDKIVKSGRMLQAPVRAMVFAWHFHALGGLVAIGG